MLLGVAALVPWDLIRINGTYGFFQMDWSQRWAPTAEKLAQAYFKEHPTTTLETVGIVAESAQPTDWPGFRGPCRDGIAPGTLGDWKAAKPRELWRHPVGPGWSSVCVVGDLLFTQEQRGEEELVVCYKASTGEQVWTHADEARYADGPSGPGPRGTPTFHNRQVFTLGARGLVNCLDAATGKPVWQTDLKDSIGAEPPNFGIAASPLIVGDKVIINLGSKTGPRMLALDIGGGSTVWSAAGGAEGYSSPHLAKLHDIEQILIYNSAGLFAHNPENGEELWSYPWPSEQSARR